MSKLPRVSASEIVKALMKIGYVFSRQKGSHIILLHREKHSIVVVPNRKELPKGTLRSIINQANLTVDEFLELIE